MREDAKHPFFLTYFQPENEQEKTAATFTGYALFAVLIALAFLLTNLIR